jgi:16S rRNA A1518/A1519 N6-dimethyltransferase RsmA/KsgA/DIM1 with predicted DNA glycosylase/AP lyase activity
MSRNYNEELQNNSFREYNYKFDVITRRYLLKEFSKYFRVNSDKVLEVGSYDGSMTELILEYFNEVDIVEASSEMAQTVQGRFGESQRFSRAHRRCPA